MKYELLMCRLRLSRIGKGFININAYGDLIFTVNRKEIVAQNWIYSCICRSGVVLNIESNFLKSLAENSRPSSFVCCILDEIIAGHINGGIYTESS